IGTIVYLINGMHPHGLDNGSVTESSIMKLATLP
ncbi:histidine phosphatase family protein, partial [Streptococcus pneumoniae]|nr:histidine phosphatase family protein [Streptococcus pneumoniae]